VVIHDIATWPGKRLEFERLNRTRKRDSCSKLPAIGGASDGVEEAPPDELTPSVTERGDAKLRPVRRMARVEKGVGGKPEAELDRVRLSCAGTDPQP
jgi:hypothetical protein